MLKVRTFSKGGLDLVYPHVQYSINMPGYLTLEGLFFQHNQLCIWFLCSHVMTFFDRKVDLAQFATDDPLYMMCRTWMRNDPSNSEETVVPAPSPPQSTTDKREIYRY